MVFHHRKIGNDKRAWAEIHLEGNTDTPWNDIAVVSTQFEKL
jgi:hypothetical protein